MELFVFRRGIHSSGKVASQLVLRLGLTVEAAQAKEESPENSERIGEAWSESYTSLYGKSASRIYAI